MSKQNALFKVAQDYNVIMISGNKSTRLQKSKLAKNKTEE